MFRFRPRAAPARTSFFAGSLADYGLQRVRLEAKASELETRESVAVHIFDGKGPGRNLGEALMLTQEPRRRDGIWFLEWATREDSIEGEIAIVERHPPTFDLIPMSNGAPFPARSWKGPGIRREEWSLTTWKAGEEVPWWAPGLRFWTGGHLHPGERGQTVRPGRAPTPARALFEVGGELYDYCCDLPRRGSPSPARIEEVSRDWNGLGERTIRILLPRGYDSSRREYPICYWHDGQNMFADSRPEGHWVAPWSLASAVERLTRAGEITDAIHVAVDNTPDRLFEYMPPSASFDEETDRFNEGGRPGEAQNYLELLRERVHPYMLRHYRAMDDPQYTGMAGSSLGGLATMYAGWEHPDFARRLGVFSGTFWAAEKFVRGMERQAPNGKKPLLIYLDSGTVGPTHDNIDGVLRVRDALIRNGWLLNFDLKHVVGVGHRHNELAWKNRLDDCLRFLFPAGDCFHAERSDLYRERVANTVWRSEGGSRRKRPDADAAPGTPIEMKRGGHAW